ncbi:phosphatidylinositol/phosphatidylcholine transfer protein sfh3 [Quercus suber]|uniref:Phosphatidylinositol/phosphatidylcholine transfer protein sfh3 n=1 Tax=Quercus suber TaxID=58331 RepID=A0AAW0KHU3_QUESU
MGIANEEAVKEFRSLMEEIDEPLKNSYKNMHQGYPTEALVRFLKARDWNVAKAHKMLVDCLHWRVQNGIDNILSKPIIPIDLYRAVRDSHLQGFSGYTKQGLPVIAIGLGLSTFDKASVNYYVQSHIQLNEYRDRVVLVPFCNKEAWTTYWYLSENLRHDRLKLSALNNIKLLTAIATIDDLNYPEKTDTYYIVNAPYIFSACWKVVKPLLQERTRRKIQVLQGCGRDELLKIMDYGSLPHFCRREGSGSSKHYRNEGTDNCFSLDHAFHQQLYNYINQQALSKESTSPIKQGSMHVEVPEPNPGETEIMKTIQTEFHKLGNKNGLANSLKGVEVNGD